jgi:hypothetical protein
MKTCPNCGAEFTEQRAYCEHCGAALPAVDASAGQVWPPPPAGQRPPNPELAIKLVTRHRYGDVALGIVVCLASMIAYCIGLIVMPVMYFKMRSTYPYFTRGIGIGLIIVTLGVLGFLATCIMKPITF